ncbi:flavoprotein [Salmonella enterica subsp. arizonae]|uniref:Flavoprotein n=1 Tax=Salmonella enterica subsp. arizonae TaxID=59203 RepID=A0A379SQ51_SALER|nr:flavoprotein [Salmonella enterica subsp. arizonae]
MMSLVGKKIVLGVSGGIAAYKTPELVRRLRERGADVRVAMTEAAKSLYYPSELTGCVGLSRIRQFA